MATDHQELTPARLDRLVPLNRLSAAARAALLDESHRLSFDENGLVQAKGERGDMLNYLLSGRVELVASETLRRVIDAGDDEAQHPLDAGNPKSYTIVALSHATVLRVPRGTLQQLLQFSGSDPLPLMSTGTALAGTPDVQQDADAEDAQDWMERTLEPEFFARLPVDNLQRVFQRLQRIDVVAGQVIVRPGQRAEGFYVVASGTATLSQSNENERVARIAELGPGESFGEDLLLADNPCGVRVTMRTDGVLMRLGREDFLALVWDALVDRLTLTSASELVAQGAVWLDVRPARRFRHGSLPGARHMPLGDLRAQEPDLEKGPHYVVVSDDPARCGLAAFILARRSHVVSYVTEAPDFLSTRFGDLAPADLGRTFATAADDDVVRTALPPSSHLPQGDAGRTGDAEGTNMQPNANAARSGDTMSGEMADSADRDEMPQAQLSDFESDEGSDSMDDPDVQAMRAQADDDPGTQNDVLGDTIIGRSLADLLDEMDDIGRKIKPGEDGLDTASSLLGDDTAMGEIDAAAAATVVGGRTARSREDDVDTSIPVPTIRADQVDMQTLLHAVQRQMTVFLAAERSRIRTELESELEQRIAARTERVKQIARDQVREKVGRLQDRYRSRNGEREEALRRSYEKLMRLARQVRSQKVEIQQTKRELEEKLGAASALHRQVDEIRGLLSTRIEKLQVLDDENDTSRKSAEG